MASNVTAKSSSFFDDLTAKLSDVGVDALRSRFVQQPTNQPVVAAIQPAVTPVQSVQTGGILDQKTLLIFGGIAAAVIVLVLVMK